MDNPRIMSPIDLIEDMATKAQRAVINKDKTLGYEFEGEVLIGYVAEGLGTIAEALRELEFIQDSQQQQGKPH